MEKTLEDPAFAGWFGKICAILEWLTIRLLITLTILLIIQVFARNVFAVGLTWADELSRFCGLGVVFLAAPVLLRRNQHVRVTMFVKLLPAMGQTVAQLLSSILENMFCLFFAISAVTFMSHAWKFVTPALGIPNIVYFSPALVGMALLWVGALEQTVLTVRTIVTAARKGEDQ